MKITIAADIDLAAPSNPHDAWVTRLQGRVETPSGETALVAKVAIVHVGEIADALGDLRPAMAEAKLETVHDIFFDGGWYKDDFADGAGIDLLFVESLELGAGAAERNLDLAVVRRLADTIGSGCQLVVLPYKNALEAARWARLGFTMSTPGRPAGLMHLKLGMRNAHVFDATGSGVYEVRSSLGAIEEWQNEATLRRRACN